MTEQKKPGPGQWLIANDDDTKVFLIGKNSEGQWVIEWEDGTSSVDSGLEDWHHEPDCTGWDWQPPDWVTQDRVPARPGIDEKRWVTNGVVFSKWMPTRTGHSAQKRHGDRSNDGKSVLELRCLRKDLPPLQETWPKYYETNSPANVAFIKIDKDGTVTCVHIDGSESNDVCGRKYIEGFRKELAESEALSRITKPAEPDYREALMSAANEFVAEFAEPQPSPLRIYATADDVLYIDTHPRQTTHHEVDLGVPVVITLKEVGHG